MIFKCKSQSKLKKYRVTKYDDIYVAEVWQDDKWHGVGPDGYLWVEQNHKFDRAGHSTEAAAQLRLQKFYNPTVISEWTDSDDIGAQ